MLLVRESRTPGLIAIPAGIGSRETKPAAPAHTDTSVISHGVFSYVLSFKGGRVSIRPAVSLKLAVGLPDKERLKLP